MNSEPDAPDVVSVPVFTDYCRFAKSCSEPVLREMLRLVQARLGTPHEQAGDVDLAEAVTHQLRNL